MTEPIPFNRPFLTGRELAYIARAHEQGQLAGDGSFTRSCSEWLEATTGARRALLTHSCPAALEMGAMLAVIGPGDEVIMPSFTFVSSANAFVARGATPVFVDIRPDTMNIDEALIEAAITERTRAIVVVHYAGVACEMDAITALAAAHDLLVIEDAAHALLATYHGRPLGSIGHLGTLSFHETKNIISGEGGALLVNDARFSDRAEIIREKGTDRSLFFRGLVDKYTWVDVGGSYVPSEIVSAFLLAQLQEMEPITRQRSNLYHHYCSQLAPLEQKGLIRLPHTPEHCQSNYHLMYLLVAEHQSRYRLIQLLADHEIMAVFHYVPLHTSPMGTKLGCNARRLPVTENTSKRLVRLPMYFDLDQASQQRVIDEVLEFFKKV